MAQLGSVLNTEVNRHGGDHEKRAESRSREGGEAMNAADPRGEPRTGTTPPPPEAGQDPLPPDQARQGEVVFGTSSKRNVYFAIVAAAAVIGLILIFAFT